MNRLVYFVLFLFFCSCSDKKEFLAGNHVKIQTYLKFGHDSSFTPKQRFTYNKLAEKLIKASYYDSIQRLELYALSKNYFGLKKTTEFHNISQYFRKKAKSNKDTVGLAIASRNLAVYHDDAFQRDSAFLYFNQALKLNLRVKSYQDIAENYFSIAAIQYKIGDYAGSEQNVFKSISHIKNIKNPDEIWYRTYSLLAIIYCELREFTKSLEYHQKSIKFIKNVTIPNANAITLNNMGNVYLYQKEYNKAKLFFEKALKTEKLIESDLTLYAMVLDNLAYTEMMLHQKHQVLRQLLKAYKIRDSLNIVPGIIISQVHLSEYHYLNKNNREAFDYAQQSYINSHRYRLREEKLIALKQLITVNPRMANEYGKEYIQVNDSIQNEERKTRNKFARIAFETEEIQQEKAEAIKFQWVTFGASIITITLIILALIVTAQRAKGKKLTYRQEQHKANNYIYQLINDAQALEDQGRYHEKKRIAKELHDGVMNQLASTRLNLFILTKKQDEETINKCLYFINNIENIEKEISNVANDLINEKISSDLGYTNLLEKLFAELQTITKSKISYKIDASTDWKSTSAVIKMNIYRILQETMQNAIKYAKANKIIVTIENTDTSICITVKDDGAGFLLKKTAKGIGIKNIGERIKSLSGTIDISSQKAIGTTIIVNLPANQTPTDHAHEHPNPHC